MRVRPAALTLGLALAAVVATAGSASAHEEINPKTFPTGQPTFLTLTAANEASVDLVKIVLKAPAGLGFGETTRSPAGWSASGTDTTITWTGGAVKPDTFETWGFEIEGADQPGPLAYTVTLGFAGGKTEDHEVDVNATAPGTPGAATAATTVTTAPVTSTTPSSATAPVSPGNEPSGDTNGASGTAKAALAVAIVSLLVAAGALAVAGPRRGAGPAAGGPTGGVAPGAAQDW